MVIGKIKRVDLRQVWRHEAHDLTVWLEENIDVLNEQLDIEISIVEREKSAGDFSVDLLGEFGDGQTVVIENQLEKSDHDHLGKLITYLAALDADAAVWIVKHPREEHKTAIGWLNAATEIPFYLVQLEAIRIGDSPPAPLLTLITGPSVEARAAGKTKKELSERGQIFHRFWTQLLAVASTRTKLHSSVSPRVRHWLSTGAGHSGLGWSYVVRKQMTQVELYIDVGDQDVNLSIFDELKGQQATIEKAYGAPLDWQRLETKRGCRICDHVDVGGWDGDETLWAQTIDATVDAMIRLEKALGPRIRELKGRGVL